ncbi:hypothetical protein [Collimonas arenae]|uniref:hypothetical protein n=1 Tax=Collimonas arenae TaxID=279058 RepID=UPI00077827A1|nr:hypothetical protein [Collimonas arenae]
MNRTFGLAALVGFIISLIVHISALLSIDVLTDFPYVWLLHVGIFVVFIPFVFLSRKTLGAKPKFAEIRAAFPSWVVVVGAFICAYAVLNFVLFMVATEGGSPSIRDGKYLLLNHGKLIRELTFAEYTAFRTNEVRGFSGHWLVFYFVPFAYFAFRKQPTLVQ